MHLHNVTPHSAYGSHSHRSRLAFGAVADWSPESSAAWVMARDLGYARIELEEAIEAFEGAKAHLGRVNRRCAKAHHARPPAWQRKLLRADAFTLLNRYRGRLVRARKALAALEGQGAN